MATLLKWTRRSSVRKRHAEASRLCTQTCGALSCRARRPVRSFYVEGTSAAQLVPILRANIAKEASVMTDEAGQYTHLDKDIASHEYVNHGAGEYGRGDVHTNTLEGYFSIFKRGMKSIYQHCSEKQLHRYVAEFDFRYNNRVRLGVYDGERIDCVLRGIKGKRLTYRWSDGQMSGRCLY